MQRTLIVYTSRYGHTDMVAKALALVLGPARLCAPRDFPKERAESDFLVIGGPVYGEALDPALARFVADHADWLRRRKVALFCTCLEPEGGARYLQPLCDLLGEAVIWARPIGGALSLSRLLEEDFDAFETFCEAAGLPFQDMTSFDAEILAQQALQIKALRDSCSRRAPADELRSHIERFLTQHNTCTLTTGFGERVRGTPVEYVYRAGRLYIFSEGGEKFANILLNRRVSVSVYDPYVGVDKLAGIQMAGDAYVAPANSRDYADALELKGLDYARIAQLPMALNLLVIRLSQAEFLWSAFADMDCDVRQYYTF